MRIRWIFCLICILILISGCWKYGKGSTQGYIYAVDDGIFWDQIWFKTSLESSESDCYLIDDDDLKEQLSSLPSGQKIKLYYDRHFYTFDECPEGTGTQDEITDYEILSMNVSVI